MPVPKTAPEQVAALVALGFSAADAEPYADAALSLDQILDHMCADGVVRV
jgi:Holliday junction resolvasome RuvABC DNA-binding subunit